MNFYYRFVYFTQYDDEYIIGLIVWWYMMVLFEKLILSCVEVTSLGHSLINKDVALDLKLFKHGAMENNISWKFLMNCLQVCIN